MKNSDQIRDVCRGELEVVAYNATNRLGSTEILSGTPTIAASTNLNHANIGINTVTYVQRDTGETVAVNKAVLFTINPSTSVPVGLYTAELKVDTDASTSYTRSIKRLLQINVV